MCEGDRRYARVTSVALGPALVVGHPQPLPHLRRSHRLLAPCCSRLARPAPPSVLHSVLPIAPALRQLRFVACRLPGQTRAPWKRSPPGRRLKKGRLRRRAPPRHRYVQPRARAAVLDDGARSGARAERALQQPPALMSAVPFRWLALLLEPVHPQHASSCLAHTLETPAGGRGPGGALQRSVAAGRGDLRPGRRAGFASGGAAAWPGRLGWAWAAGGRRGRAAGQERRIGWGHHGRRR